MSALSGEYYDMPEKLARLRSHGARPMLAKLTYSPRKGWLRRVREGLGRTRRRTFLLASGSSKSRRR